MKNPYRKRLETLKERRKTDDSTVYIILCDGGTEVKGNIENVDDEGVDIVEDDDSDTRRTTFISTRDIRGIRTIQFKD